MLSIEALRQGFWPVWFLYFHHHTALRANFPDAIPDSNTEHMKCLLYTRFSFNTIIPFLWQFPLDRKLCELYWEIACNPNWLRMDESLCCQDRHRFKNFFESSNLRASLFAALILVRGRFVPQRRQCREIWNVLIHAVSLIWNLQCKLYKVQ